MTPLPQNTTTFPIRKPNRLKYYNYASNGAYFITMCSKNRECVFGKISTGVHPKVELSRIGRVVDTVIKEIPVHYSGIKVGNYVIMPNHIHLILLAQHGVSAGENGRLLAAPTTASATHHVTISSVIKQFKMYISKQCNTSIWQRSFHDHIIRNEQDYVRIWEYIDNNPVSWLDDCFYVHEPQND
jgi:REP element-mobilizing transposase RayT